MRRTHRIGMGLIAVGLLTTGCFGPFNLTRRLYRWNEQVGDRWEKELVFLLLNVIPVYSAAAFGDAVVLNSMEFWTGKNPVDPPGTRKSEGPQRRRIARGSDEAVLTRVDGADQRDMMLEFFRKGRPAGTLQFRHRPGEPTIATDADGQLLLSAQTQGDGSIVLSDASGRQVAAYSTDQVQALIRSNPQ